MTAAEFANIFTALFTAGMVGLLYWQVRQQVNATKASLYSTLIDELHHNPEIQNALAFLWEDLVETNEDLSTGRARIVLRENQQDVTRYIDRLLKHFQLLGHLIENRVLSVRNLQSLQYEIVSVGRNSHIQSYLRYLDNVLTRRSGIPHQHFEFFRRFGPIPVSCAIMN